MSIKREFFINIVFLILANLLIKPFYLLWIEVEVNNIVGPSVYGTYAGIFSLCFILQIFSDPGILNYNTIQIASNKSSVFSKFPSMLGLKISLGVIYAFVVLLMGVLSGYGKEQWDLLFLIMINVLLVSFCLFLRSNISGIGKYRWDSFFSILDKSLMIGILAYMIYISDQRNDFSIKEFILGQMLAYSISCFALLIFISSQKIRIIPRFNFSFFKNTLKASLPYAWLLFLMLLYTKIDLYMLERIVSDEGYQAGIYASSFRIFDAINSFAFLFAGLLLPIISSMLSEKADVRPLLSSVAYFLFSGIAIICIILSFHSGLVMQFLYPKDATSEYNTVFILLMLSLIPNALMFITGSFLTANGELKLLNKIAFLGVLINVFLNFWLISSHKAEGAAIATLVTQYAITTTQAYFCFKILKIPLDIKESLKVIFFILSIIFVGYYSTDISTFPSFINIGIQIIICGIIALVLGMIRIDFFKLFIKKQLSK